MRRLFGWMFPWSRGYRIEVHEDPNALGYFSVQPENMHIDALLLDIEQSAGAFNSDPGGN